jgi:hypothetical protein
MYFSRHISSYRVSIFLCGLEQVAIEVANNLRYYLNVLHVA